MVSIITASALGVGKGALGPIMGQSPDFPSFWPEGCEATHKVFVAGVCVCGGGSGLGLGASRLSNHFPSFLSS